MVNLGTIQPPRNFLRLILILAGASIILVLVVLYFALSHGQVVLFPTEEKVQGNFSATLDASTKFDPAKLNQVPGRIEQVEKKDTKKISVDSEKPIPDFAHVTVVIHNNQPAAQPLLPRTQLVTKDGIKFRTDAQVTVPAGGSIEIGATADQKGKKYNIEPSRFSIIKLSPQLQQLVYAESTQKATGGERFEKAAIQKDIDQAQKDLIAALYKDAEQELKSRVGPDEKFIPEALQKKTLDKSVDVSANTVTSEFTVTAKVRLTGLIFDDNNLLQLAIAQLKASLPAEKELVSFDPKSFKYEIKNIDQKAGSAKLTAELAGVARPRLSNELLDKEKIKGLSRKELVDHYQQFPEIDHISVTLSPFWLTSLPTLTDHITIELGKSSSLKSETSLPQ